MSMIEDARKNVGKPLLAPIDEKELIVSLISSLKILKSCDFENNRYVFKPCYLDEMFLLIESDLSLLKESIELRRQNEIY